LRYLLLIVLASVPAFGADDPADLVRQAADGWTKGAVQQDAAALQRYLADDLQYAHAGGNLQNKEQYIAAVTKGRSRYESFTFSDVKVKFYGDAAVLTAYVDVKLTGQEPFRVRTLQVYTRSGNHWRMAAHQSTRLAR
jgi:ketosteroid isomerase-like protein